MPAQNGISSENPSMRVVALLTPLVILILLVLAVIFYKERMLYIDAPHTLFRIINDGNLHIEEHRYGSFISQAFPWLGVKMHLPLKALMVLYSVGFYLFYLAVAILLVFRYRNYGLAVLLGLYFTLFVSETFYWPNNEVHQGIAWLLLAFAAYSNMVGLRRSLALRLLVFFAVFFLAIWTHPLVMLAAVYLWFFFVAGNTEFSLPKAQIVLFSLLLLALAYIKFYQGVHHGYDSSKLETLAGFDIHNITTVFSSKQFHFFINSCITHYWLFTILFISGLVGLLIQKKYLLLIWTVVFAAGYLVLTCITFRDSTFRSYLESEYAPLVIICCAPFVYYVLPKMKMKIGLVLFAPVYSIRIIYIFMAATPFTNRVVLMEKMNAKMREKNLTKIIIREPLPDAVDQMLITNWGAPMESLFISKLRGEVPQRTFIFLSADRLKEFNTASKDTLLGAWEKRAAVNINSRYIQIDTGTAYQTITYNALMD